MSNTQTHGTQRTQRTQIRTQLIQNLRDLEKRFKKEEDFRVYYIPFCMKIVDRIHKNKNNSYSLSDIYTQEYEILTQVGVRTSYVGKFGWTLAF